MKKIMIIFILVLIPNIVFSQSTEEAEKMFLYELNVILQNSAQQHWKYEGKMTIDSAFALNKEGLLSVAVRYETDSSVIKVRMEAPLRKAKCIEYDLYLILEFDQKEVIVFESELSNIELEEKFRTKLFHIGIPLEEGDQKRKKLQKLLGKIMQLKK